MQYSWPGNIRELINTLEYAFVLCKGDSIALEHMPGSIADIRKKILIPAKGAVGDTEKQRLIWALNHSGGKKTEAARVLRVSRQTIWKKIKKYGIQVEKNIVPG
jgi:two-component system response regulator HydG